MTNHSKRPMLALTPANEYLESRVRTERVFSEYRLQVVSAWPNSARKSAVLAGIESRASGRKQIPKMDSDTAREDSRASLAVFVVNKVHAQC
jgi:hypothetical protein